jgi:hypothetical protein
VRAGNTVKRARPWHLPALAWTAAKAFGRAPFEGKAGARLWRWPVLTLSLPIWWLSLAIVRPSLYWWRDREGWALLTLNRTGLRRWLLVALGVLEIVPALLAVSILSAWLVTVVSQGVTTGLLVVALVVCLGAYLMTMYLPYRGRIWRPGPDVEANWTAGLAAATTRRGLLLMRRTIEAYVEPGATLTIAARDESLVDLYTRLGFTRVTPTGAHLSLTRPPHVRQH